MDLKEIKRIIEMVEEANISSLALEHKDLKIEIKKELTAPQLPIHQMVMTHATPASPQMTTPQVEKPITEVQPDAKLVSVKSPMVGTFYSATNPELPAFVKIGDKITEGKVICIIEAMKIFNEIETDISGVVEKICVENGATVEYGQELFCIRI